MVKHIILWNLKDEFTEEQKADIRAGIKEGLEGLAGQIPGLIDISVRTEYLPSSTVDVMLDTTFESAEALKNYSTHPKHVAVADSKVRPYTAVRSCIDYEVQNLYTAVVIFLFYIYKFFYLVFRTCKGGENEQKQKMKKRIIK